MTNQQTNSCCKEGVRFKADYQMYDFARDTRHTIKLDDVKSPCSGRHRVCTFGLLDKIVEKANDDGSKTDCFAEEEASRIIYQVLKAVSYLHKQNVVHGDIKPKNILLKTKHKWFINQTR